MKAKFSCPNCGQKITVGEAVMGKRGKCPGCEQVISIPTAEQFRAAATPKKSAPSEPTSELASDPLWDDDAFDSLGDSDPLGDAVAASESAPASREHLAQRKAKRNAKSKKPKSQRPKTWRAFGGMVLGIILMLATIPAAIAAFFVAGQMSASNGWPSVQGRVLMSHVKVVGFGKKKKYQAEVRYDYEVNSRWHTGSRVRLGDTTGNSESRQQAIADKYPVGSEVAVYYDPKWPEQSVLEPGGWPLKMAIPPIVLAGIGWVFFGVSTGRIKT